MDVLWLSNWITSNRQEYSEGKQDRLASDIVWLATVEGKIYWILGEHHNILYSAINKYVSKIDIVAAGRIQKDNKKIIWNSDLLKIDTDEIVRPFLAPLLIEIAQK